MKMMSLYIMSVIYILAGLNHFRAPQFYRPLMPPWIPLHNFLIYFSGALEIILGAGLLWKPTQISSAWGIIAMLIAFLPVHFFMYQARTTLFKKIPSSVIIARIPLQVVLMGWAYIYTF
jgi:uncharacterized membrane protein